MNRLFLTFIVVLVMLTTVASLEAVAQTTSPVQGSPGTEVIFDKDDLLNAMSDAERQDFLDRRKELKELQEDGRKLDKGKPGRKYVLAAFEAKKAEFEEKFGYLRGFKGERVMVYGNPAPTKGEIMEMVLAGGGSFSGGNFGYGLSPHWTREESGAVVGSDSPPSIETSDLQAGPEVSAEVGVDASKNRPRSRDNNGCTHGIFGIPDDTPECRAAMKGR